jgi:hypothetical protein
MWHDYIVKRNDYNVKWNDYNVKQYDYTVNRHDYTVKRHDYNVKRNDHNIKELGLSHPLSRQRVCPFPRNQRGGDTLACGLGVGGVPIPTTGRKSLAVCLLCGLSSTSQRFSVLSFIVLKILIKIHTYSVCKKMKPLFITSIKPTSPAFSKHERTEASVLIPPKAAHIKK